MSDAQERLIHAEENLEVEARANYRVDSRGGQVVITPVEDKETTKARAVAKLDQIGKKKKTIFGQDGRALSLASRATLDTTEIIKNAKENCKNPIKISWKNVKFEVEVKQTEEEVATTGQAFRRQMIVKDCSGYAAPGVATYIMGSSGAGKTSLLNILSDRVALINKAKLQGEVMFNDIVPINQDTYARYAAYVMQDDILFSHFTAQEALTFSARLRLTTAHDVQDKFVVQIIRELGLYHVKDSQIGSVHRKVLSGGERKRVSVGMELVSDPSLIMLDEPTSGLDSFKARSICKLLHDLAEKKGKTIVATIHQPSSEAFFYFDRIILMADGYTCFQGEATEALDYFRSVKFNVPKRCNPSDFFMKALDVKYPKQADDIEKLERLNRAYKFQVEKRNQVENKMIKLEVPADYQAGLPSYRASVWVQLSQLMFRSWILAQREPRITRAKLIQTCIVVAFLIPTFWQLNDYENCDDYADASDPSKANPTYLAQYAACKAFNDVVFHSMVGAMYFLCVMQMFLNFLPTVIVFQSEKPVFVRERASNMYDIWIYATTKMIAEIPIMLLVPLILVIFVYPSIGFQDSLKEFSQFYFILALMVQAATAMGYFLSSAFNSETAAVAFAPILNLPLSLLGGYMINLNSIKGHFPQALLEWLQYVSPVRYCFNGLMQAQWPIKSIKTHGETVVLQSDGINQVVGTQMTFWTCAAGLFALWIAFRFLTVISLTLQDKAYQCTDPNDERNTEIKHQKQNYGAPANDMSLGGVY